MIRPFGVIFASPEAFLCSLFKYETHEKHWPFLLLSYCVIINVFWQALADIFWRIDSSGAGLKESLWQKIKRKRKEKIACPFFYLSFPFLFFLFQAFNSYPAWKNLPDCINPDVTGIFHFLMRSRVDLNAKRHLKEIWRHVYPWRYFQKIRGYWSFRHLTTMLFSWTINRSYALFC